VAVGVWVFFHTPGKNGFDSIPLYWLFAVVTAPLVSLACVIALWRQRAPAWLAGFATLLLLPQCIVWYFAVEGVLYYLGLVR
jgi:hypothetical protein